MSSSLPLPVGPKSTRAFIGYKLPAVGREEFFGELGHTFMPGTPYMQASLGLNAYVPAVLDPEPGDGLPDEVALIVYSSLAIYEHFRKNSLRRRMYTHAHAGVFDMAAAGGGGQFPGTVDEPSTRDDRFCWYLFDQPVDWQSGSAQLVMATPESGTADPASLRSHTAARRADLEKAGVNQLICVATPRYAALWLHSDEEVDVASLGLLDDGYSVLRRNLKAEPVPMPNLEEGVEIEGASMYTFRFVRELRFHL